MGVWIVICGVRIESGGGGGGGGEEGGAAFFCGGRMEEREWGWREVAGLRVESERRTEREVII